MSIALEPQTSDPQASAAEIPADVSDEPTVPTWHAVCELADLEPEWGEAALVDGQQVALYRLWDDSVRAVSNQDPATGSFVMARGIVGTRSGRPTIASPLHKQVYDLQSGECLSHPGLTVPVFGARISAGTVEVCLESAA